MHFIDEATLLGQAANPENEYVTHVLPKKIALAKENKADDSLVADLYSDSLTAQSGLAYA